MTSRLVAICVDAAEISLVKRGIAEGWLPALRRLRERGRFARIRSNCDVLVASVWHEWLLGQLPAEHGFYSVRQWCPERMATRRPDPSWLPMTPFYRRLGPDGPRVLAVDVPFAPTPEPFNGVEVVSWNAQEKLVPSASHPPELAARLRRELGGPLLGDERYGPQTAAALAALRDTLLNVAERQIEMTCALAEREPWDLLLMTLSAAHRAGHRFWSAEGLAGPATDAARAELCASLRSVYSACDDAVDRITTAAGDDATVMVFSLHGMTDNNALYFLLPEMLRRVLERDDSDGRAVPPPRGLVGRVRESVPLSLRDAVKSRLPIAAKDALSRFWARADRRDWSRTRAVCLGAGDLEGQIQVNLRGREREGVVEPGAEYDALCAEIADGLESFVDDDSGAPLVADVLRLDEQWPEAAQRRLLPDLVVRWASNAPRGIQAVRSPRFGVFANPHHGTLPDGRSGHHQPIGWFIGAGAGIEPGETPGEFPIFDLPATICAHFGVRPPDGMRGTPIPGFDAGRDRA